MKFQFDWQESVAESGRQAEAIFKPKSRKDLLEKSSELRSTGDDIVFIDNRLTGVVTQEEWKNDWSLSDQEWEFWSNATPDWA